MINDIGKKQHAKSASAVAAHAHGHKHHVVPVDEARERAGEDPRAYSIQTAEGVDDVGEELGEDFVENATGADDAAVERRAENVLDDDGDPIPESDASEAAREKSASSPHPASLAAHPARSNKS